jgi:hypothetical protein
MERVGRRLAELGYTLRSGSALGADAAFERGCDRAHGSKQIFLPRIHYNGRLDGIELGDSAQAQAIAAQFHPAWDGLPPSHKRLLARNVGAILGPKLDKADASAFVVAWTHDGRVVGGTGHALRIAEGYGVPVVNLAKPNALVQLTGLVRRV